MKRKQALKVMGMVLAGSLVLSEASPVPVRAASAAVQSSQEQDVSDEQETSENAAVCYIDTKNGNDKNDGSSPEKCGEISETGEKAVSGKAAEFRRTVRK